MLISIMIIMGTTILDGSNIYEIYLESPGPRTDLPGFKVPKHLPGKPQLRVQTQKYGKNERILKSIALWLF